MWTIDERIKSLEREMGGSVPGTQIARFLDSETEIYDPKLRWSLAIGGLCQPKQFFNGDTIEECIKKAEDFLTRNA